MRRLTEPLGDTHGVYFDAAQCLVSQRSRFQLIEVFSTAVVGKLMRLDGANMLSERDEFFYHENLIHPAAIAHPQPRNVLIVGGGDGGAAEELLKHASIERCTLCEIDRAVIDVARAHFSAIHRDVFDDARLQIHIGDGEDFVRAAHDAFDLIYLDVTDPMTDAAGAAVGLYTEAFYAQCRNALRADGALVLHIGSAFSHPQRVRESLRNLRAVFRFVTAYFVHIPIYGATWGFAYASDAIDLSCVSETEVASRLEARAIGDRQYFNAATFKAMQALPEYVKQLIQA